jgi:dTDP-3-amino-2,3,6-trideoxy-4-keto-D-glucose/dTDP-3-amino-3,4,6-trideoxy-alpha-D-glucose/dTDP-2,6-dideoxy-D-kanosamine transaminase
MKNYLPSQYNLDSKLVIKHNYLKEQFSNYKAIFSKLEKVVKKGDYTLGNKVNEFENKISKLLNAKYVVALGSGTDALMLSLKALGVKEGDEVITTPYTFYATIGAIVTAGAIPIFVDVTDDYNINPNLIEKKITKKTKAILPVHWSGRICNMKQIIKIANKHSIPIVEDACHAITATQGNKFAGNFGTFGCFSLHPLKNLNVWGDGGFLLTNSKKYYEKILLLRNHGLISRNVNKIFGYNSRLDTVQAVVAIELLKKIKKITNCRISNSKYLDSKLKKLPNIITKDRAPENKEVFHLYEFRVLNNKLRNKIIKFLIKNKIDAKIHYPIPMHLQPASKIYGYKKGDFPVTEKLANTSISLPVHEFITKKNIDFIVNIIKKAIV